MPYRYLPSYMQMELYWIALIIYQYWQEGASRATGHSGFEHGMDLPTNTSIVKYKELLINDYKIGFVQIIPDT